jgi:hypothetical protein
MICSKNLNFQSYCQLFIYSDLEFCKIKCKHWQHYSLQSRFICFAWRLFASLEGFEEHLLLLA